MRFGPVLLFAFMRLPFFKFLLSLYCSLNLYCWHLSGGNQTVVMDQIIIYFDQLIDFVNPSLVKQQLGTFIIRRFTLYGRRRGAPSTSLHDVFVMSPIFPLGKSQLFPGKFTCSGKYTISRNFLGKYSKVSLTQKELAQLLGPACVETPYSKHDSYYSLNKMLAVRIMIIILQIY